MPSSEIEQRVMSERRPQGPPPTPRNPALERTAGEEVAAAFANLAATKRRLIARAAGVDPIIARELGY